MNKMLKIGKLHIITQMVLGFILNIGIISSLIFSLYQMKQYLDGILNMNDLSFLIILIWLFSNIVLTFCLFTKRLTISVFDGEYLLKLLNNTENKHHE